MKSDKKNSHFGVYADLGTESHDDLDIGRSVKEIMSRAGDDMSVRSLAVIMCGLCELHSYAYESGAGMRGELWDRIGVCAWRELGVMCGVISDREEM